MRVVVTGNWVAIEAYGINRLEECQTARTHTYTSIRNVQKHTVHKDRGVHGVIKDNKITATLVNNMFAL